MDRCEEAVRENEEQHLNIEPDSAVGCSAS